MINELKRKIFQFTSTETVKKNPEARFLILLRKSNTSSFDTFTFTGPRVLEYNGAIACKYPFNVMDSIRKILNWEVIDCSSD